MEAIYLRFRNLTGQKFGRLLVRGLKEKRGKHFYWDCTCKCGNACVVEGSKLTSNHTQSCGCLRRERTIQSHTTHNMCHDRIYHTWAAMKRRCLTPSNKDYPEYGGRGIKIHEPWVHNFQAFYNHVNQLEHFGEEGYTLDRIDTNGNYEPGNVRWADAKTQARNTRKNTIIEYQGRRMTAKEAAELSGINYGTLITRIQQGDTGERLFRPVRKIKKKGDD